MMLWYLLKKDILIIKRISISKGSLSVMRSNLFP